MYLEYRVYLDRMQDVPRESLYLEYWVYTRRRICTYFWVQQEDHESLVYCMYVTMVMYTTLPSYTLVDIHVYVIVVLTIRWVFTSITHPPTTKNRTVTYRIRPLTTAKGHSLTEHAHLKWTFMYGTRQPTAVKGHSSA